MKKLILTDCDDVLCAWNDVFAKYMEGLGFPLIQECIANYNLGKRFGVDKETMNDIVREFNTSKHIEEMTPLADAQEYVGKLVDLGFKFIVITSANDSDKTHFYRTNNLVNLFGPNFLEELICLPMGSDKYKTLERWENSGLFWCEDKFSNAMDGCALGLESILVDRDYNKDFESTRITRVSGTQPWKEIYNMVLKKYKL
jgi:hypothetical protein